jgi:RNA polymerase sigma-70 factor (ECF subfamily)
MTQTATPTKVPSRQTDAALLRAAAQGDEAAFVTLYRAHRERVFRVAYGVVLDQDDARDVVQETFLKLHQAAAHWQPDALVSTWLYRVALNQAISTRRKLATAARGVLRTFSARTPESDVNQQQAINLAQDAMATLSAAQRAAVTLLLDAQLSPSEMAPVLGMTPNAARVTLHRGLEKLRAHLKTHGIDAAPLAEERVLTGEV